jgi:hypothetical protein
MKLTFLSPLFAPLFGVRMKERLLRSIIDGAKAPTMVFDVECIGPDGKVKWRESAKNLVTNQGRVDILDKYLKGSTYTASWFLMLKGTGSVANADTLASNVGWDEVTPYSGNRPAITWGTTTGTTTATNTATAVSITINATATVAGAGCCTVNTGTSGILYNVSDFAASRSVASGDTLNVTPTITMS